MVDKLDYKKEDKNLYMPKEEPSQILVPKMNFIMVEGKGNPNEEEGEYSKAVTLLYALSYSIKMNKERPQGYVDYVVPPLEGLWWMAQGQESDFTNKDEFYWISMIRQPDFVTQEVFQSACEDVAKKKKLNTGIAVFKSLEEGLCVQCMHRGTFDEEPQTLAKIEQYISGNGLQNDIGQTRRHHEIYLTDPRKTEPDKRKTVLRIPVK